MVLRFSYGRLQIAGRIEHTVAAVCEPATLGVPVCEGGHDDTAIGAGNSILGGDKPNLSNLIAKPWIGQRLQLNNLVQVGGVGHSVEETDRRKAA